MNIVLFEDIDKVRTDESKANVKNKNISSTSKTPLMLMSMRGNLKKVKKLLTNGADINEKSEDDGTALIMALQARQPQIASILLDSDVTLDTIKHCY